MAIQSSRSWLSAVAFAVTGVALVLNSIPAQAHSQLPRRHQAHRELRHRQRAHRSGWQPVTMRRTRQVPPLLEQCHTGRLIGGLVGGGVGYAASRDQGRSWAIPLGVLLGSQVGCRAASGRGWTPW